LIEMIQTIEKVVKKNANRQYLPMQPGDVLRTCADISKASRLIGYAPKTCFEEGIKAFYKWQVNQDQNQ
ncbi:MAG: hypothetical protein ACRCST_02240, partial [Turicibacter sp.]